MDFPDADAVLEDTVSIIFATINVLAVTLNLIIRKGGPSFK
jgi:hypothetical protein